MLDMVPFVRVEFVPTVALVIVPLLYIVELRVRVRTMEVGDGVDPLAETREVIVVVITWMVEFADVVEGELEATPDVLDA